MTDGGAGNPTSAWYSTLLHELVHYAHWVGAADRLDRGDNCQAKKDYAFEELVAEIGSVFLMAGLGMEAMPIEAYAGYAAGWLKALRGDKRFIFRAAAEAGRAADWLMSHERQAVQTPAKAA